MFLGKSFNSASYSVVISSLQCEVFQQSVSPEKHWLCNLMFKFAGVLLLFSCVYYIRLKLCIFDCFTFTANAWRCSFYLFSDTRVRSRLFFRLPLFFSIIMRLHTMFVMLHFTDQPETKKVATNDGKLFDLFVV